MSERAVYSVSELTSRIKERLETDFPAVWVQGEISNLRIPGSGHAYFTLKDETAQLRAVLFRNRGRRIRFEPEDGMQVLAFGGLDVYAARGEYQLVVELLEPKGVGALYVRRSKPRVRLTPEIDGGGHEQGMRSGTLNVPGIVGLGKAAQIAAAEWEKHAAHARGLNDRLRKKLFDALLRPDQFADPVGEVFVIGHGSTLLRRRPSECGPDLSAEKSMLPGPLLRRADANSHEFGLNCTSLRLLANSGRCGRRLRGRLERLDDDVGDIGHRPHIERLEHLGGHIVQVGLVALRDENR